LQLLPPPPLLLLLPPLELELSESLLLLPPRLGARTSMLALSSRV
jgi:hypothetical protein